MNNIINSKFKEYIKKPIPYQKNDYDKYKNLFGQVISFDGAIGEVKSDDIIYTFPYTSTESQIKIGDIVSFRIKENNEHQIVDVKPYQDNKMMEELIDKLIEDSKKR